MKNNQYNPWYTIGSHKNTFSASSWWHHQNSSPHIRHFHHLFPQQFNQKSIQLYLQHLNYSQIMQMNFTNCVAPKKKKNHHMATSPFSQSAFLSVSSSPPQPAPSPTAFDFFYKSHPHKLAASSPSLGSTRPLLCPSQQIYFFPQHFARPPRPRIVANNSVSPATTSDSPPTPHASPSTLTTTAGSCKTTRRRDDFFTIGLLHEK